MREMSGTAEQGCLILVFKWVMYRGRKQVLVIKFLEYYPRVVA